MIKKQTYINALRDALPDHINSDALAEEIVDIVFSVPVRALENGDSVEIPELGVISINKSKGKDCLAYEPAQALLECVLK